MKACRGSAFVSKYCFMPSARDGQSCLAQSVKERQSVIVLGEGTGRACWEFTEKGSNIILKRPLSPPNLNLHTDWVMETAVIIWHLLIKPASRKTAHSAAEQNDCCRSGRSVLPLLFCRFPFFISLSDVIIRFLLPFLCVLWSQIPLSLAFRSNDSHSNDENG